MSTQFTVFSNWTKQRRLGLRLMLPFTWCFCGALVSGIAIWQWTGHSQQQNIYQNTTLALTGYLPKVAQLRQLACESGRVTTGTTREAELIRTQVAIKDMQKEVQSLPEELKERPDLIHLVTQMSDLVDKVTGHNWEEAFEEHHEPHAEDKHAHHEEPKAHAPHDEHGAKPAHEVAAHEDAHGAAAKTNSEHATEHGDEHHEEVSETLHAQIETGFTLQNLPLQIRSIDSLFQTQVSSATEYLASRSALLNDRMRICGFVLMGSVATMLISSIVGTAKLYNFEQRMSALANAADKRLNKVRSHYHPAPIPRAQPVTEAPSEVTVENNEKDVVAEFLEKLAEQMSRLPAAVEEDRLPEVEEIARWLAGAAGTFGFDQFTQPARQLESAVQNSESEQIQALIDSLEQLTAEVAGVSVKH